MADDPAWEHRGKWSWPKYFEYASRRTTYATYVNLVAYINMTGTTAVVMQEDEATPGKYAKVWEERGIDESKQVALLRRGQRYDFSGPD